MNALPTFNLVRKKYMLILEGKVIPEYKSRVMSKLMQGNVKSNIGNTGESQTPEQEKLSRQALQFQEWLRKALEMFLKMGHSTDWFSLVPYWEVWFDINYFLQ